MRRPASAALLALCLACAARAEDKLTIGTVGVVSDAVFHRRGRRVFPRRGARRLVHPLRFRRQNDRPARRDVHIRIVADKARNSPG